MGKNGFTRRSKYQRRGRGQNFNFVHLCSLISSTHTRTFRLPERHQAFFTRDSCRHLFPFCFMFSPAQNKDKHEKLMVPVFCFCFCFLVGSVCTKQMRISDLCRFCPLVCLFFMAFIVVAPSRSPLFLCFARFLSLSLSIYLSFYLSIYISISISISNYINKYI